MSNYSWFQHNEISLFQRYDVEQQPGEGYVINGLEAWTTLMARLLVFLGQSENEENPDRVAIRRQTLHELMELTENRGSNNFETDYQEVSNRSTEELIATVLLLKLRISYRTLPANCCPRLFISHRRDDKGYALRIAKLALDNNFAFWLDVLDPDLTSRGEGRIPEKLIPLITACIIEMALINCTHVLACMTVNSRGTLWIPYEYGRIRELPGITVNTCAWWHPDLPPADFPEYMLLGEIAQTESQISTWLETEMKCAGKGYCAPVREDVAVWGAVERLPEDSAAALERIQQNKRQAIEDIAFTKKPLVRKHAAFKYKNSA